MVSHVDVHTRDINSYKKKDQKIRVWVDCPFKRSQGSCIGGFVHRDIGGGKASLLKAEPQCVVRGIPECKCQPLFNPNKV